jgi:zinc transport system ATP-binding protein
MAGKKLLELKNISAGYNGKTAIQNASIRINSDDFIGIIGPNGGGKTTLIKVILGLIKPYQGKIINYLSEGGSSIGYLPQINQFDKKFPISVKDTILAGFINNARLTLRFSKEQKDRANSLMVKMGIEDYKIKPIGELSGGQMQRVFLCRALVSNPKLLILDEPNTFVDNKFENELYEILKELNKDISIVMVSHDVGMISSYVKTIACVNKEVHYHESNIISQEQLNAYNCPIQLITHGNIPHTVLASHHHNH